MKNLLPLSIILAIFFLFGAGFWLLFSYENAETKFLKEQGFANEQGEFSKSQSLAEQNINNPDESFEVLATKLDKAGKTYQMAFKLENKSNEKRDFYLIPVSKNSQAEFKEIKGLVNNKNLLSISKEDAKKEPLQTLYDVEKHKKELNPELAKAYYDIDNNSYLAKPIKITLDAKSNILAKSEWQVKNQTAGVMEPIYLLVYGSAGGAKDGMQGKNPDGTQNYKNKWMGSYETICFNTADGDLGENQYAIVEGGNGYLIRTKPKDEAQFEYVDSAYNVSSLEQVQVVEGAKCYYDEFLTAKGAKAIWKNNKWEMDKMPEDGIMRIASAGKKYWDTVRIKNHPQPERIEIVTGDEVVPEEPPQPRNKPHSIALDATSNSGYLTNVSSFSWSHTCAGANRLLVLGSSLFNWLSSITVSSATYNGDNFTSIRTESEAPANYYRTDLRYMVAPDAGDSYTVSVTLSGTVVSGIAGVISYVGAKQTGQPDANNGTKSSGVAGTTASVNITTVADNSWVVAVMVNSSSNPTAGNTERWEGGAANQIFGAGSDTNGPKTPAGSQTMSWTWSTDRYWAISAASFAPAPPNNAPTISSVSDYPDPLIAGNTATFSADWADADAEGVKLYICKAEDGTTGGCGAGGTWCSNSNDFETTDPIICNYTTQSGDAGTNNYYAYVCDDEPTCSSATAGTFTVQAVSAPSKVFKGGTIFKGGGTVK